MEKRKGIAFVLLLLGLFVLLGVVGNVDHGRGMDLLILVLGLLLMGFGSLWIRALEIREEKLCRRAETQKGNGCVCK